MTVFDKDGFTEAVSKKLSVIWSVDELSLKAIADDIGVSTFMLHNVRKGCVPKLESFLKFCDWMNVEPSVFFVDGEAKTS